MNAPLPCPYLQTTRLLLCPLQEQDAEGLWQLWSSPDFADLAGIDSPSSKDSIDENIKYFKTLNASGFYYKWAIRDRLTHEFIGEFELYPIKPQIRPWIEWGIGFSLTPHRWRQGLMSEALRCVMQFVFTQMPAIRVKADVHLHNEASLALLRKMGFTQEGIQRSKLHVQGRRHDMHLLAMSQHDFLRSSLT